MKKVQIVHTWEDFLIVSLIQNVHFDVCLTLHLHALCSAKADATLHYSDVITVATCLAEPPGADKAVSGCCARHGRGDKDTCQPNKKQQQKGFPPCSTFTGRATVTVRSYVETTNASYSSKHAITDRPANIEPPPSQLSSWTKAHSLNPNDLPR